MTGVLRTVYDFLTSPSEVREAYQYLPCHGALLPLLLINIFFVLFCFRIGPWFMRNREPYNLKRVIIVYNIFQIIYNTIMSILSSHLLLVYIRTPRGIMCIEQLSYDHPYKNFEILCGFLYLANKFTDLSETVFFILRKSFKQVTFLHVYHHVLMTSLVYCYFRYQGTGGHPAFGPCINSYVHAIMYVYYLMSSLDENIKKSLWWKKYITQIQLLQFVIGTIHVIYPLTAPIDCPFPKIWLYFLTTQGFLMLYLFGSFYYNAYVKGPKVKQVKEKKI